MKKIILTAAAFSFMCRVSAWAQTQQTTSYKKAPFTISAPAKADTSTDYTSRQLRIDEVNLTSSYYSQNGNHSAITGGIGTQQVTDLANGIELKLLWLGDNNNKNTLTTGLGIDHHSSASSAYITLAGTGKKDGSRIYPSLDYTHESAKTGNSWGFGSYYSGEYNYKSFGSDIHFGIKTADKSGEFTAKAQAYWDQVVLIYPVELIAAAAPAPAGATYITTASGNKVLSTSGGKSSSSGLATSPRNTYTLSLAWSQMINQRLQIALLGDAVTQNGMLSLPYHRVYLSNGRDTLEHLPSSRFKIPVGARINYFLGDNVILRGYYRYYADNWGSKSNTVGLEVPFKITPFFSISPYYRFYSQTAAKYFGPYQTIKPGTEFFTSNYEYAELTSNFFGAGFRVAPPKGVFGLHSFHDLEIRYGHYQQSVGLTSDVISMNIGFK